MQFWEVNLPIGVELDDDARDKEELKRPPGDLWACGVNERPLRRRVSWSGGSFNGHKSVSATECKSHVIIISYSRR